jgi:hypothetical protein
VTPVSTAVRIDVDDAETDAQPIAEECPFCFAIVRKARLDRHFSIAHAGGTERPA